MIISHRYKFIFVKTRKTAGSSIEMALSNFCGKEDVITPDDALLRKRLGYPVYRNCGYESFKNYNLKDWYRLIRRFKRRFFFHNHISACEIMDKISAKTWRTYFKFCFERNSWDKVISFYYYKYYSNKTLNPFQLHKPSLSDFIQSKKFPQASDWDLYTVGNKIAVDHVCRYENLNKEMEYICKTLGLPNMPTLPKAKVNIKKDNRHYSELLNDKDRRRIEEVFSREINFLGYHY